MLVFNTPPRSDSTHCDCGLPLEDCLELGGSGGGDGDGESGINGLGIFSALFDGPSEEELIDFEKRTAIAQLGKVLDAQSVAIAAFTALVLDTYGLKN